METYSTRQTSRLAGVSYRQIDYWLRAGVLGQPSMPGSGCPRRFTFEDVCLLRVVAHLARLGAQTDVMSSVVRQLRGTLSQRLSGLGVIHVGLDGEVGRVGVACWTVDLRLALDGLQPGDAERVA